MVLDVNYFPSYKELKNEFTSLLRAHFLNLKSCAAAASSSTDDCECERKSSRASKAGTSVNQNLTDPATRLLGKIKQQTQHVKVR
jgi:hypothetical protein